MATIKKSNTTRIFEDNNFGRFLPILSNENLIEKLIGSKSQAEQFKGINQFLEKKRINIGDQNGNQVDPKRIAELLQSISIYGKYTNEIINELADVNQLGKSFKITYINHDEFKNVKGLAKDATVPDFLNNINIVDSIHLNNNSDVNEKKINVIDNSFQMPYQRDFETPGLSVFQVINPEFRGCFKHSQELDLFFNMINTLDMSMAIPYVNAEFLIPNKVKKQSSDGSIYNDKSYLTASLNNFILGDDIFQQDLNGQMKYNNNVTDTARAINGDYFVDELTVVRNSVKTSNTEKQSQIKKTYSRQSLNNAIFFAPQTMVNADYNIADNPNAIVDKFRPFMSITNLSFDVRPTKGLMFYKTATLDLILYDKARMNQIAPFIKPELLNTVSSEIILEYGWQHNLGDGDYLRSVQINNQEVIYSENPIAEFINSLKVREKYIIVNSSYTINQNGTVNINLSLAMKGPAELRGLSFKADLSVSKMKSNLNDAVTKLKADILNGYNIETVNRTTDTSTGSVTREITSNTGNISGNFNNIDNDLNILTINETSLKNVDDKIKSLNLQNISKGYFDMLVKDIAAVQSNLKDFSTQRDQWLDTQFPFLKNHDARKNDPYIDEDWWNENLGTIAEIQSKDSTQLLKKGNNTWNGQQWISLGKIITGTLGSRLILEDKKYSEVQFVFYNLNGKAIQASFLNIASVPVDLNLFKTRLQNIIYSASRLSVEGILDFILNIAVNQKAAAVYGLGKYFKFTESNSSDLNIPDVNSNETTRKLLIDQQTKGVNGEIYKQYYGTEIPTAETSNESANQYLNDLNNITAGVFDLTFNVPKVVMNFDSTYHENNPESSILRISFYDERDNPFESITEFMTNFHNNKYNNALTSITKVRAKVMQAKSAAAKVVTENAPNIPKVKSDVKDKEKKKKTKTEETASVDQATPVITQNEISTSISNVKSIISKDINDVIFTLIQSELIVLKDANGSKIDINSVQPDAPLSNNDIRTIAINIKDSEKIKSFQNMKSLFKTMMPSLTFGQSNSALISGNISTQQDAKYSTMLLMKQNGEEAEKEPTQYDYEVFSQANNAPMWVIPAQASAQIIGCPLVNFSQLVFLDFNTGTSIDNMYFINGIKHSISPGKFTTDLTLIQKDVYSQFEASALSIKQFIDAAEEWKKSVDAAATAAVNNKTGPYKQRKSGSSTSTTSNTSTVNQSIASFVYTLKINADKQ